MIYLNYIKNCQFTDDSYEYTKISMLKGFWNKMAWTYIFFNHDEYQLNDFSVNVVFFLTMSIQTLRMMWTRVDKYTKINLVPEIHLTRIDGIEIYSHNK